MKHQLRRLAKGLARPQAASEAIQRRLMAQDWWAAGFQVGIYRSTANEPCTDALLADLLARRARVAVPVRRGAEYGWGWVDENTRWQKGAHGIPEPAETEPADARDLRVVVVPGVAFDAQGGRLGHGQGHFDRLLARSGALLVGLCFENRLVETVPVEPHDVRMDMVATEKRMFYTPTAETKLERLTGGGAK
ncbi:MAG TPA: 5-formyltetrahydrofolate cyclo-ligase [Verrucomicrobia bacterium]|nr:5-formyltetrahydrofolate cyclo-ligase [Verrucomicrobiota bacterium]